MKNSLLIDEMLSRKLVSKLSGVMPTITHISSENLQSEMDIEIWNYAKEQNRAILTKDSDFKNLSMLLGCPPKVVHINCGNKSTDYILKLLISKIEIIINFLASESDCYLELS